MTINKKMILDGDTLREYTEAEYAQNELDKQELARIKAEQAEVEATAAAKRAAAEAKLEALGLTPEDLKALGI
jgi:adenylylsulfate kinase-like enzyme